MSTDNSGQTIIAMERAALDRWGKGDPDGFIEIYAPDIVYFDPFLDHKIESRDALKRLYDSIRGKVHIDHYELVDPVVQVCRDVAVLTFNFVSSGNEGESRWNTTEIYQQYRGSWHIIHSHWSLTQPNLAKS